MQPTQRPRGLLQLCALVLFGAGAITLHARAPEDTQPVQPVVQPAQPAPNPSLPPLEQSGKALPTPDTIGPAGLPSNAPPPVAGAATYPQENEAAAIAWLDERFPQNAYPEMYAAIFPTMKQENRPELQWRYVRTMINYYEMKRTAPDAEKLEVYKIAEDLVRKCIAVEPVKVPHCYLYLGIAIGRQGTLKGVLKSLRLAKEVEGSWLHGLELSKGKPYKLDSDLLEAHFYYTLGIFYRIVPDWWIIKLIAGTRGDKVKSIQMHRESVRLRPDVSTFLELGVSLMCKADEDEADPLMKEGRKIIETDVLKREAKSELDRIDQANARKVLEKASLACGYSRDKFQDVKNQSAVK